MADKIKAIKIKQKNGTYTGEIPISVNVQNVQWDENNHTLLDALGSVDISSSGKGNLQHQIDELDGDKISTNEFNSRLNDFLRKQISADTTDWLDDNVNPVGSAVIVDKTLTIEGAAADALAVKTELNKKANASNTYTKAEVNAAIDAKQIEVDDTLSITGTAADAKAVGDEFTEIKADLDDVTEFSRYHPLYDYLVLDGDGRVLYDYNAPKSPDEITQLERYYPYTLVLDKDGYVVFTDKKETVNAPEGLKVSIIGDSISSYEGWVPTGYKTFYPRGDVTSVENTWWKQLLQKSGMKLCVNASWSGSSLGWDITESTNSYSGASDGRIADLTNPDTQETPNIIICYICTNDWGASHPIGEYSSKMAIPFNGAVTNISQGYALMLYKIRNTYPDALVYCVTHLDGRHSTSGDEDFPIQDDLGQTLHEVNHMIIELAHVFGARVIDLETCGVHPWNISEYTIDGHLHPNKKGHALIADTMYRQIKHDFE